jgi:hypothetical protein
MCHRAPVPSLSLPPSPLSRAQTEDSQVRRRTWVRNGVRVAQGSLEETRAHLLTLTARLARLEEERLSIIEFNTKMADELKTRATMVTEYEVKIRDMQMKMAEAAATGEQPFLSPVGPVSLLVPP